jgi:zinc transporter
MVTIRSGYDSRGLIWGYELGTGRAVGLADASGEAPVWFHLNLADARARTWLTEESGLPEDAIGIFLDPQARVQLQVWPAGLCGVLEDLHHDFHGDPEGFGGVRFFVDARRVISARRHPLKAVDVLHRKLERGAVMASAYEWLDELVEALTEGFAATVHDMGERVDVLEDEIVAGKSTQDQRAQLAGIRRLLVRFRRHVTANRAALGLLRLRGSPFRASEDAMRHGLEQLDGVGQDLELVHERVRLLQEEVATLLAEATNRNLYVLSIVTTALLPATLVSGIWGMNVGGVPWADDGHGFVYAFLVVVASIGVSLLLLRGSKVV